MEKTELLHLDEIRSKYADSGLSPDDYRKMPTSEIARMRLDVKRLLLYIDRLSTHAEEDNKALTVEELRGMEQERVWVQFRDLGMYALVAYHADPDGDDGEDVYLTNNLGGRDTYDDIIGTGGEIYRRPPEKREAPNHEEI